MGIFNKFRRKIASAPPREEVSPGGSTIYRYKTPENIYHPPREEGRHMEEISAHFDALFPGRKGAVFHELISDLVHIDIHILEPDGEDSFYVLYTTGMSDLPMTLPEELANREELKYCELYLFLPSSWNFGTQGSLDENLPEASYWPIGMLKFLARFPHEYRTWLGWGHTIPNGAQYAPLAEGVDFGGVVLSQTEGVSPLNTKDGKQIHFYLAIPAYQEEIEYKLKYGMEALGSRFTEGKLPLVLDMHRPNLCAGFTEILD